VPIDTSGRVIAGRWKLEESIGDGGMSEVSRGTDIDGEYADGVAAKMLPAPRREDRWAVEAFEQST